MEESSSSLFDATKTEEKGENCREFLQWKLKRETSRVLGEFQEFVNKIYTDLDVQDCTILI
jgi:hypothetical protein